MKFRIVILAYNIIAYILYKEGYISIQPEILFISLYLILTTYLSVEIINVRKNYIKSPWLNPVVISSLFSLILGFGIVNIVFTINDYYNTMLYDKLGNEPYSLLSTALFIVIMGAVSLWIGYDTKAGVRIFSFFANLPLIKKILKKEFDLNKRVILFLYLLSILFRLIAVNLGIYGYSADELSVSKYSSIELLVNIFGQLGNFVLLVLAISYFAKKDKSLRIPLFIVFIVELFFGFISGSKGAVVTPVLILIISNFIINKKIKKSFVVTAFVLIVIAYMVIEPFRYLRYTDPRFRSDIPYIVSTMSEAQNLPYVDPQRLGPSEPGEILLAALMRNTYIIETAKAIDYADNVGLTENDPDFKTSLITIPFQAYIPRLFWETKPISSIGGWFTRTVWGWDFKSSTAMTPFGFLYFAGKEYLIIFFFFIFGIMCKFLYQFLKLDAGGIIIYTGLIMSLMYIDSMVNGIFVTWLRTIPILLFLQYIVLKK